MVKWLAGLGVVGLVILCFVGCEQMSMPPDILLSWIQPLAYYISDNAVTCSLTVCIKPRNSVDSYLDYIQWEYYDKDNVQVGTISQPFHVYSRIPGKRDTSTKDSTIITGVIAPIQELVSNMVAKNHLSSSIRLILTATSEYDHAQNDTVSCYVGLYRVKTYIFTLTSDKDSMPVGDSATITATVLDNSGLGVVDTISLSVEPSGIGVIDPAVIYTASGSGTARAKFRAGSSVGDATITGLSRRAGQRTVTIKIK